MDQFIKKEKIRVLFCSDSLSSVSGLSYVCAQFMQKFHETEKYEVAYCTITGANSEREFFILQNDKFIEYFKDNLRMYNAQLLDQKGMENFNNAIADFRPNIVFSNLDPWNLDEIAFSVYRESYFWVQYLTLETSFYPDNVMFPTPVIRDRRKSMKGILQSADMIIPATSIGKKVLENMGLKPENHVFNGIETGMVCKERDRKRAFGGTVAEDDFVFMTMGVNNERKKIDVVVEAFAKFLQKMNFNPKYKLFLHSNTDEQVGGTDLETQIVTLGVQKHMIFSNSFKQNMIMYKHDLYRKYKACDCYIGLPGGEGFGYGFAEAMIHGVPVIYINYGGHPSYLNGIGLPVKVQAKFNARNIYMQWALADVEDAASQMCRVVSDKKLRDHMSSSGKQFAEREFPWETVSKKLIDCVEEKYSKIKRDPIFKFNLKKII